MRKPVFRVSDLTQTGLYSHRRQLDAYNFGFRKKRDCSIHVAKTKVLISCAVTAQLICTFIFAHAKSLFSHDEAQMLDCWYDCVLHTMRVNDFFLNKMKFE